MRKFIIKSNDEFIAIEADTVPANFILEKPKFNYGKAKKMEPFLLPEKSLVLKWEGRFLEIIFESEIIARYETLNPQQVCEFLNHYNSLTMEEIQELYLKSQNKSKTELELEIESLKKEKLDIEAELDIYRQVRKKKQEINELLEKLETNKENDNK